MQLNAGVRHYNTLFDLFRDAIEDITSKPTLEQTAAEICAQALKLLGNVGASNSLFSYVSLLDSNILRVIAAVPNSCLVGLSNNDNFLPEFYINKGIGIGLTGLAAKTGKTQHISDITGNPHHIPIPSAVKSHLSIPLFARNSVSGVLTVESTIVNQFSKSDLRNLELLSHIASAALDNKQAVVAREEFIENVTHQLVGPLSGLRSHCDYLLKVDMMKSYRDTVYRTLQEQASLLQRYALNFVMRRSRRKNL